MTERSKSALIFGASGFVGGYLARELKSNGYEVFGSDRAKPADDSFFDAFSACDITDFESIRDVVREYEPKAIVNLAAISSVGQSWLMPATTMRVNVEGAINVMEAARSQDVSPKLLLVGSSEEYSPNDHPISEADPIDANSPYGISKIAQERFAELYAEQYGLTVFLTRSFNHTGPGQSATFVLPSWCRQAAKIEASGHPGKMIVGNLDVSRDFSDVRDVVRAYRLILEGGSAGQVYNIGSGTATSLSQCLEEIKAFSEQPIEIEVNEELVRPTDTPVICCDATKIRKELGWEPEHLLEDTLREMFERFVNLEVAARQSLD